MTRPNDTHQSPANGMPAPADQNDPVARLVRMAEPVPERDAVDVKRLMARLRVAAVEARTGVAPVSAEGEAAAAPQAPPLPVVALRATPPVAPLASPPATSSRRRKRTISGRRRKNATGTPPWSGWAAAAAVLLVVGVGAFVLLKRPGNMLPVNNSGIASVPPGSGSNAPVEPHVWVDDTTPLVLDVPQATGVLAPLYRPTEAWVMPDVEPLQLPMAITPETVSNLEAFNTYFRTGRLTNAINQLSAFGFVVGPQFNTDDPVEFYREALDHGQATLITVDVALALGSARLEATRQAVEDRVLAPLLERLMDQLADRLASLEGKFHAGSTGAKALLRARQFVAVAGALQAGREAELFVQPALCCAIANRVHGAGMKHLNPDMWNTLVAFNATLPDDTRIANINGWFFGQDLRRLLDLYVDHQRRNAIVERYPQFAQVALTEVERIMSARHSLMSEACGRTVHYSVFGVPDRATRNPRRANLWRTVQWLRQLRMPLAGDNVSMLAGLLTADALCRLGNTTTDESAEAGSAPWRRVVGLIDFIDGVRESLAPFAVQSLARQLLGPQYTSTMLASPDVAKRMCDILRVVRVNGVPSPDVSRPRTDVAVFLGLPDHPADEAMQFMAGLRDAPGNPAADGSPEPLELMAALGSDRAAFLLETGVQRVEGTSSLPQPWRVLRPDFERMPPAQRYRSTNTDWMHTASMLVRPEGRTSGYPSYMAGDAYSDRLLGAALAAYVLRHPDTDIHSYKVAQANDGPVDLPPQPGSTVEPLPHVYASILDVVRHARLGLEQLDALPVGENDLLLETEATLQELVTLSRKVLAGEDLGQEGIEWIAGFANKLELLGMGQGRPGMSTVTTFRGSDPNAARGHTRAGGGGVRPMWILSRQPNGEVMIAMGCVSSYFQTADVEPTPMHVEAWRELARRGKVSSPDWMNSYISNR